MEETGVEILIKPGSVRMIIWRYRTRRSRDQHQLNKLKYCSAIFNSTGTVTFCPLEKTSCDLVTRARFRHRGCRVDYRTTVTVLHLRSSRMSVKGSAHDRLLPAPQFLMGLKNRSAAASSGTMPCIDFPSESVCIY
jgi:hypothetical protein